MAAVPDLFVCTECLCDAVRRAGRTVTAIYDHALAPHGIGISQFTMLVNLELRGPTALGELARLLELDRTTLTRNLALLEQKNWARSRPDSKDGRVKIVSATRAGRAAALAAFPAWREAQDRVEGALHGADVRLLGQLAKIPH